MRDLASKLDRWESRTKDTESDRAARARSCRFAAKVRKIEETLAVPELA